MVTRGITWLLTCATFVFTGIYVSSCADKKVITDPGVLSVELTRTDLHHDLFYPVEFDERSLELEFSESVDSSTVRGNISFSDKDGALSNWIKAVCIGRKVILEFLPGFEMKKGWRYEIGINRSVRTVNRVSLPAPRVIEIRTSGSGILSGNDPAQRNSIFCISDLHMGEARAVAGHYCWFSENAPALENLLDSIKASKSIRQLVILGDLFDEWVIPYRMVPFDTANGIFNTDDYFHAVAGSPVNAPVVARLKSIAASGTIQLIYVPGNHDMLLTPAILEDIIPGVVWQGKTGSVGDFSPVDEIIMEHGHRFDLFNCPQPLVNPGHILPPGYFISRLQAEGLHETGGSRHNSMKSSMTAVEFLIAWTSAFEYVVSDFSMMVHPDSANIPMGGIDGYTGHVSFNAARDMYAASIENVWNATQVQNGVPMPLPVLAGLLNGGTDLFPAVSSEYLSPGIPKKYQLAVLGHTHEPEIKVCLSSQGYSGIYANTGSWVNASLCKNPVRTYVVVSPAKWTGSELDVVSLYQYNPIVGGSGYKPELMQEESISF